MSTIKGVALRMPEASKSCSENGLFTCLPRGPKDRKNECSLDRVIKPFPCARKAIFTCYLHSSAEKFARSKFSVPGLVLLLPEMGRIEKTLSIGHFDIEILNLQSRISKFFFFNLWALWAIFGNTLGDTPRTLRDSCSKSRGSQLLAA